MNNNNLIKKGSAVAVIFLLIGLAFTPIINADVSKASTDEETVEFTTEVCGIYGTKLHTVELTTEEANEVDRIFENIRSRLNESKSRDETEEILNEAVEELDNYGLLGSLGVKHAQKLVTGRYRESRFFNWMKKKNNQNLSSVDVKENFDCDFTASVSYTCTIYPDNSFPFLMWSGFLLDWIIDNLWDKLYDYFLLLGILVFFMIMWMIWAQVSIFFSTFVVPFTLWSLNLTFGEYKYEYDPWTGEEYHYWYPSEGWVWTNGSNGVFECDGKMFGDLGIIKWDDSNSEKHYGFLGVEEFRGIKIFKIWPWKKSYYLGHASHVRLKILD